MLGADAGATTAKVQHGGRWNRHLGGITRGNLTFQVLKIGQLDVFEVTNFVDDAHHRRCQLLRAIGFGDGDRNIGLDAANLLQKINVKIGATELAISDAFQAHILLKLHDLADGLVFYQAQLLGRDDTRGFLLTRFKQKFGAQKAAHMIVMGGKLGHAVSFG